MLFNLKLEYSAYTRITSDLRLRRLTCQGLSTLLLYVLFLPHPFVYVCVFFFVEHEDKNYAKECELYFVVH